MTGNISKTCIILVILLLKFMVNSSHGADDKEHEKKYPSGSQEIKSSGITLAKTQQEKDDEARKALVFVEEEVLHLNKDQIEETNENS